MERQSWCSHQSPVPIPLLFIILAATDTLLRVHRISLFLRIVGIAPSRFVATPDASAKPKGRPVTKQPSSYGSSTRLYNTVLRVLCVCEIVPRPSFRSYTSRYSWAENFALLFSGLLDRYLISVQAKPIESVLYSSLNIRFSRNKRHRLAEIHWRREQVTNAWNFWQNPTSRLTWRSKALKPT